MNKQLQNLQCQDGTVLENGSCTDIPNYYAISKCEKAGGNYDPVKLSCSSISPILESHTATLSDQNLDQTPMIDSIPVIDLSTLVKIIIPVLLIYFLIRKIRKKIKQRKTTTSYLRQKIVKTGGSTFAEKPKEKVNEEEEKNKLYALKKLSAKKLAAEKLADKEKKRLSDIKEKTRLSDIKEKTRLSDIKEKTAIIRY